MGIDLRDGFNELGRHAHHQTRIVFYGGRTVGDAANVALECETCGCVLLDFDRPEPPTPVMYWLPKGEERQRRFMQSPDRPPHDPNPTVFVDRAYTGHSEKEIARIIEILGDKDALDHSVSWRGFSSCRICDVHLGTRCYVRGRWRWPEKAEHYVLKHGVWIPEFSEMLEDFGL